MIKNISSQKGQGLLEAVFALGILLMVAGAILALSTSNVVGQKSSEFQVRANNLGREGIEVVRSIRDGNWLSGEAWDFGLTSAVSIIAIAEFDDTTNLWQLSFDPTTAETVLWLNAATGVHSHKTTGGTRETVFLRNLELKSICLQPSGAEIIDVNINTTCTDINDEKIGMKVTSIVSWNERGQNKEIRLIDLLYAWR